MAYRTEELDILVVNLSRWEGQQLSALLEHAIAEASHEADLCALIAAMESLSEADALACWKRQNIDLELRAEEAGAVVQALEWASACCTRCAAAAHELRDLPARLSVSVETRRSASVETPMVPVVTLFPADLSAASPVAAY
jgi:hypothetical protein